MSSDDADKKILARARELFGKGAFERISSEIFAENISLYSVYADTNAALIMRRDDFGEIFISPELLADTAPIRPDIDRTFAICVGALPQLAGYLERRQISACVYHDYYGWGYFAARTIAEKLMDGFEPSLPARLLAPLVATPQDADSFKADWRKWIK